MKLIIAYVQPNKLVDVKRALDDAEVHKMSVISALGCGQQRGYEENYRGTAVEVNLMKKVRFEIAVNDDYVEPTIDAIVGASRTGNIGDGKIFVLPIGDAIRVRTGERGPKSIA